VAGVKVTKDAQAEIYLGHRTILARILNFHIVLQINAPEIMFAMSVL